MILVLSAQARAKLLPSTLLNLNRVYDDPAASDRDRAVIDDLLQQEAWTELDDRFYKDIAFGTGGMRGRTIGKVVTAAEQGTPGPLGQPEFPGTGTNLLNYSNVHRAVSALGLYLRQEFRGEEKRVVIAHDTRFFSREFSLEAARALNALGIDALVFPEDRSTPQLSFTVRLRRAQAGIMITASHNPPHDNGMKFYSHDGGQMVEPHASAITSIFQQLAANPTQLAGHHAGVEKPGQIITLSTQEDQAYQDAVADIVLEPSTIQAMREQLKLVYTPLHGTGLRATLALLTRFGFQFSTVLAQSSGDGRFPTVQSPNPENAEALILAMAQAEAEGADLVMATDPDCDRMGVAVRDGAGKLILLTGNQIGSIFAYYRLERLFAQGILNEQTRNHAVIIKTFVTTDLQQKIADHFGVRCINTLTGFKYIGEKMYDYEKALHDAEYEKQSAHQRREKLLARSQLVVFAGEESYGYTGGDYVRDKDGNAAVLMIAEAAAWAKAKGQTLLEYLDLISVELGYYSQKLGTLTFEGASGAQQIQKLLASFRASPPTLYQKLEVTGVDDFGQEEFHDLDGKLIPQETLLIFHLSEGSRMAVRGSGTEPKIKFYFFTQAQAQGDLAAVKAERHAFLEAWWTEVQEDVNRRVA